MVDQWKDGEGGLDGWYFELSGAGICSVLLCREYGRRVGSSRVLEYRIAGGFCVWTI